MFSSHDEHGHGVELPESETWLGSILKKQRLKLEDL